MSGSVFDKPINNLKFYTLCPLAAKLTLQTPKLRDWMGVASFLGFTGNQVNHLQQYQESGKGWLFLNTWAATGQSSVRKLIYALLELKMKPCLDILRTDPDITEEDLEAIKVEFEHLKQEDKLRSLFPVIDDSKFYEVIYPQMHSCTPVVQHGEDCQVERLVGHLPEPPKIIPKTVYISYLSEPGIVGIKPVLSNLAHMIKRHGYTVYYKPFCNNEIRRLGGVNNWKEYYIQRSENIVVVCTPNYFKEDSKWVSSTREEDLNSKLEVDCRLLRQLAYNVSERERLMPIVLDCRNEPQRECVPIWLQSAQVHKFPSERVEFMFSLKRESRYVVADIDPSEIIEIKPKIIRPPKRRTRTSHK